jgi:hypothetical protein
MEVETMRTLPASRPGSRCTWVNVALSTGQMVAQDDAQLMCGPFVLSYQLRFLSLAKLHDIAALGGMV